MAHDMTSCATAHIQALTDAALDNVTAGRKSGEGQKDFLSSSAPAPTTTLAEVGFQILRTIVQAL